MFFGKRLRSDALVDGQGKLDDILTVRLEESHRLLLRVDLISVEFKIAVHLVFLLSTQHFAHLQLQKITCMAFELLLNGFLELRLWILLLHIVFKQLALTQICHAFRQVGSLHERVDLFANRLIDGAPSKVWRV